MIMKGWRSAEIFCSQASVRQGPTVISLMILSPKECQLACISCVVIAPIPTADMPMSGPIQAHQSVEHLPFLAFVRKALHAQSVTFMSALTMLTKVFAATKSAVCLTSTELDSFEKRQRCRMQIPTMKCQPTYRATRRPTGVTISTPTISRKMCRCSSPSTGTTNSLNKWIS